MQILKNFFKGNTLYYPGCLTKFVLKDILDNYKKILEKQGIEFIMLKDREFCCGSPLKNSGMEKDFLEIAEKNFQVLKEHGVDRIITNCPACAAVFRNDYKKMLGTKWDINVVHFTEIFQPVRKNRAATSVTYHDPCHLGRALGVFERPRQILQKSGYEIKEMELTKEKSFCCGGGGGIKSNNGELANRIAKDRGEQAKKTGAKILVTPCPMCYANLKENNQDVEVKELSELI